MIANAPAHLFEGAVVADRYRVVSRLSQGATASVFEVEHVATGHRGAMKLLGREPGSQPELVARAVCPSSHVSSASTVPLPHPASTHRPPSRAAGALRGGVAGLIAFAQAGRGASVTRGRVAVVAGFVRVTTNSRASATCS